MTKPHTLPFEAALLASAERLSQELQHAPSLIRPYSSYLAHSAGKALRARLLLSSSLDANGEAPLAAVDMAAAIELLHLATLIHDDVMDEAEYRRGQLSVQKQFGKRKAVIAGDYLLAQSLQLSGKAAWPYKDKMDESLFMLDYAKRIALGEMLQTLHNGNFHLGLMNYFRIIAGKTAALFEAATFAGFFLSDLSEVDRKKAGRYKRFGRYLGMIFQLTDDCLDYESSASASGKSVKSDLEQAVITLPLLYAMEESEALYEEASNAKSASEIAQVYQAVKDSQGLARTRQLAHKYLRKAERELSKMQLSSYKHERLSELLKQANRQLAVKAIQSEKIYA